MCKDNYDYYKSHLDELCKKFNNKYIAIKEQNIIGVYESFDQAFTETSKTEELGTFIIQLCSKDETSTVNYFYSNNVIFS